VTVWEAFALIGVAVLGPGGFLVAVVSSRRTRQVTQAVAESVGVRNGHGTIQDQGAVMIARMESIEQAATGIRVAVQSLADNQSSTLAHLRQHDREIAENKDRLSALEAWRHALRRDALSEEGVS